MILLIITTIMNTCQPEINCINKAIRIERILKNTNSMHVTTNTKIKIIKTELLKLLKEKNH